MGLFDFWKQPKDPAAPLKKLFGPDGSARLLLTIELSHVEKHVSNMRAVGRHADALKRANEFLLKIMAEWRKNPPNPWPFEMIADAAICLGALELGKQLLEMVVKSIDIEQPPPDLPVACGLLGPARNTLHRLLPLVIQHRLNRRREVFEAGFPRPALTVGFRHFWADCHEPFAFSHDDSGISVLHWLLSVAEAKPQGFADCGNTHALPFRIWQM